MVHEPMRPVLDEFGSIAQLVSGYLATGIAPGRYDGTLVADVVTDSRRVREAAARRIANGMRVVVGEARPRARGPTSWFAGALSCVRRAMVRVYSAEGRNMRCYRPMVGCGLTF